MVKINPSRAALWGACSMSAVALGREVPQQKTLDQLEGLAAHEFLENTLLGQFIEAGEISSFGVPFSNEMIESASELLEDVRRHNKTLDMTRGCKPLLVEFDIAIPTVHPECFGRGDVGRVDPANKVVYIFEYKYGHGYVDEYKNPTGAILAEGLLLAEGVLPNDRKEWRVFYTLAQPRCFDPRTNGKKLRTHHYDGEELSKIIAGLRAMAHEAFLAPVARPNDLCGKCPDVRGCASLRATSALICDISLKQAPDVLTLEEMEFELKYIEDAKRRLEARETSLSAGIFSELEHGGRCRFFELKKGGTTKQFALSDAELLQLQNTFKSVCVEGQSSPVFMAQPKALTFKQAEQLPENQPLVANGYFASLGKEVSGKTKLSRINHSAAERAFSKEVK